MVVINENPVDSTGGTHLNFEFLANNSSQEREVVITKMIIAGWTGRDRHAIEEHIAELEVLGVPRPKSTPCFYRASSHLITTANHFEVIGTDSSGEVECFVLKLEDGLWIGLGSDHTDRQVETYNITVSKQMCSKPVASRLWRYEELKDHWDQLVLRSYCYGGMSRQLYQEGLISALLTPEDLIERYQSQHSKIPNGTLMFCGTFSVIGGVRETSRFEIEMEDPILERSIKHQYHTTSLPNEG